jgi:hypothetical protein
LEHIFHLKIALLRSKASELSAGLREAWNNNPVKKLIIPDTSRSTGYQPARKPVICLTSRELPAQMVIFHLFWVDFDIIYQLKA